MYDSAAKVPSPTFMRSTADQEKQLAIAGAQLAAMEAAFKDVSTNGQARFKTWLAEKHEPLVPDLIGLFSFDGSLDQLANEAPGKTGAGKAAKLTSVDGIRGKAVRFDGDHGPSSRACSMSTVGAAARWIGGFETPHATSSLSS